MEIGRELLKKSGGKRGWEEGQGLGVNEQGPQEPLRVKMNIGKTGIGFHQPLKMMVMVEKKERKVRAEKQVKPPSVIEQENAHAEFQAIGRMLSAAFNDETDVPKSQIIASGKRKKGRLNAPPRSRITRTNPLLPDD